MSTQDTDMPLDDVLQYARERGWEVLPPLGEYRKDGAWKFSGPEGWPDKATSNPDEVRQMWEGAEDLRDGNVGIRVGPGSGIMVLDIDPRNADGEDPDPWAVVETAEKELGLPSLPTTLTSRTGGGGLHLYFRYEPLAEKANFDFLPGIEVAEGTADSGKFVYVPPTARRSHGGRPYRWIDQEAEIANLPADWKEAIREAADGKAEQQARSGVDFPPSDGPVPEGRRDKYMRDVAAHLVAKGQHPEDAVEIVAGAAQNPEILDPPFEDGDEEIPANGGVEAYARQKVESAVSKFGDRGNTGGYQAKGDGIWLLKFDDGEVTGRERLANFTARVVRDTTLDDGVSPDRVFRLVARRAGRRFEFDVKGSEFEDLGWRLTEIGPDAAVESYKKNKAFNAIQLLSVNFERRRVYAHTGWRRIEGTPAFLTQGGAIGPEGRQTDVDVQLPDPLARYHLPAPPTGKDARDAVEAVLALTGDTPKDGVLPDRVVIPSLGAVVSAPLGEFDETAFSVFIHGSTGSFKTSWAAVLQSFFGDFRITSLPASWSSTHNALERLASASKDVLMVIDDYAPAGSARADAKMTQKADRVLRGTANRQARQRLRSTTEFQETYVQRGLIVATGESLPTGESLRARFFGIRMRKEEMDLAALTQAQAAADDGQYRAAMAAYVQWLAGQFDELQEEVSRRRQDLRSRWLEGGEPDVHLRVVDMCALLKTAWGYFLDFAAEIGVDVSPWRAEGRIDHRVDAILKERALGGDSQTRYHQEAQPGRMFLRLLRTALHSGRAYLDNRDNPGVQDFPVAVDTTPRAIGWQWGRPLGPSTRDGPDRRSQPRPPDSSGVKLIGYIDSENIYLIPEEAFAVARRLASDAGKYLPGDSDELFRDMKDRGLLTEHGDKRTKKRVSIGGHRAYYVLINTDRFFERDPVHLPADVADQLQADAAVSEGGFA